MTIRVSKNRVDMGGAQMRWSKGADVASATTLSLGNDGNYFDITGTTTITSIRAITIGTVVRLHFDSALILTHHATNLILPGGADITTATGDNATFVEYATGVWRCTNYQVATSIPGSDLETISIAASDETTNLATGTAKTTFRMPYAFTLTEVRTSVTTAPTGATLIVDINETGNTILSTKITIDASEKTSTTAVTAPVISDTALANDAEITIDIDQIGSTVAGTGLKVYLIGRQT